MSVKYYIILSGLLVMAYSKTQKLPKFHADVCGIAKPTFASSTLPGEFPYMCAIGWTSKSAEKVYDFNCGGAAISARFVLTAAHCLYGSEDMPVIVRPGGVVLTTFKASGDIRIEEIIEHPDYEYPSTYNDIAVLKLVFGSWLHQFAYLPSIDAALNETLTAVGYGDTRFAGSPTSALLKIQVNAVSTEECRVYYAPDETESTLRAGIIDTQLCAVDPEKKMNTCQGDSGGPLVRRHLGIHYVLGITSFGVGCEYGPPGVYTRVTKYVGWIESIIRPWYNEEYAYMFAFRWRNHITCDLEEKKCGAVLIRWNFVMLAAHCLYEREEIPFMESVSGYNVMAETMGYVYFAQIVIHPEYDHPLPYNDIALINIELHQYFVTPIWLENRLVNQTLTAINYGDTTAANFKLQDLLKTRLSEIPNEECGQYYQQNEYSENFTLGIIDTQICAQDTEKKWDLKQGYSEGPLIMHINEQNVSTPYVVGISTYGKNCDNCPPGVFTRVSKYLDWILAVVKLDNNYKTIVDDYVNENLLYYPIKSNTPNLG